MEGGQPWNINAGASRGSIELEKGGENYKNMSNTAATESMHRWLIHTYEEGLRTVEMPEKSTNMSAVHG